MNVILARCQQKNNRHQKQQHLAALLVASLLSFIIWSLLFFMHLQFTVPLGNGALASILLCILSLFLGRLIWLRKKGLLKPAREWLATLLAIAKFTGPYIVTLVLQIFPIFMLLLIIRDTSYLATVKPGYFALGMSVFFCCILLLLCGLYFIVMWFGKPASKLEKGSALAAMLFFPLVTSFFLGNVSFFPATIDRRPYRPNRQCSLQYDTFANARPRG